MRREPYSVRVRLLRMRRLRRTSFGLRSLHGIGVELRISSFCFLVPPSAECFLSEVSGLDELHEELLELVITDFISTHELSIRKSVPDILDQSLC
jgi:hypothetical protein